MIPTREQWEKRLENTLLLDSDYIDFAFLLVISVFCILILNESLNYRPRTQALPMLTAILTLTLIIALVVKSGLITRVLFGKRTLDTKADERGEVVEKRKDILGAVGWVGAVMVLVYLVGMDTGSFIFLVLYYRYESSQSWLRTIFYSILTWVPIMALFFFVLSVPLYEGLIFRI